MTQTSIATSADYADALLVARNTDLLPQPMTMNTTATAIAATMPAAPPPRAALALNYFTSLMTFFGMLLPILLALDLLLILNIMLVGRLLGLARTTSAFLWCLLLMLLMFPVQAFFGEPSSPTDFRLPGLLYTWNELVLYAKFDTSDMNVAILKWTRFLVMPLVAILLLAAVQIKSNRGLRQALGEASPELS